MSLHQFSPHTHSYTHTNTTQHAVYKFAFTQSRADIIKGSGDTGKVAAWTIGGACAGALLFFSISQLGKMGSRDVEEEGGDGNGRERERESEWTKKEECFKG